MAIALNRTKTRKRSEVMPPLPDALLLIPSLENFDEITIWLGTFRERLRIAHPKDQPKLDATMKELETHYRRRRAELSSAGRLAIQRSDFAAAERLEGA